MVLTDSIGLSIEESFVEVDLSVLSIASDCGCSIFFDGLSLGELTHADVPSNTMTNKVTTITNLLFFTYTYSNHLILLSLNYLAVAILYIVFRYLLSRPINLFHDGFKISFSLSFLL